MKQLAGSDQEKFLKLIYWFLLESKQEYQCLHLSRQIFFPPNIFIAKLCAFARQLLPPWMRGFSHYDEPVLHLQSTVHVIRCSADKVLPWALARTRALCAAGLPPAARESHSALRHSGRRNEDPKPKLPPVAVAPLTELAFYSPC